MRALDLVIIFGYLIGITLFGVWFAGKQKTTADYFVGDRSVPWWAIAMSIVATETSTITFISGEWPSRAAGISNFYNSSSATCWVA